MDSVERLLRALDDLVEFFGRVETPAVATAKWRELLGRIRAQLETPGERAAALRDLDSCFGGMGSLNDVFFSPDNGNVPVGSNGAQLNRELAKLLDRTFRELRLVNGSLLTRAYWWWLERRHHGPSPRILNAFKR